MVVCLVAALAQVPLLLVGEYELWLGGTWVSTLILGEPTWFMVILVCLAGGPAALAGARSKGGNARGLLVLACAASLSVVALLQLDAAIVRWAAVVGVERNGWLFHMAPTGYPQAAFIGLSTLALVSRIHAAAIETYMSTRFRPKAWLRLTGLAAVSALAHVPFYHWGIENSLQSNLAHWELPGVGHLAGLAVFEILARVTRGSSAS